MSLVPVDDRGLALGDGLFETLLADGGLLEFFDAHAARLAAACAALLLPAPSAPDLQAAALSALEAKGLEKGRAAVRLSWTAGSGGRGLDRPTDPSPRLLAMAAPAPDNPQAQFTLAIASVTRNQTSPTSRFKTLSYLDNVVARRQARLAGADEALMLNGQGEVCCAAAANVFWSKGGRLYTPALGCGVLDGIMRGAVMAASAEIGVEVVEIAASPRRLEGAALFLTNSLIGLCPVTALDGRPLLRDVRLQQALQTTLGDLRGRR